MELNERLKLLPTNSGVYIMYDEFDKIIYVGKAKNLKNRVRQYFQKNVKNVKVAKMVQNIKRFDYVITNTEIDALSLENNLIKKHQPKYNILLKDDKTYPYLKVNLKEDYPYFIITRKVKNDGAKYFGPFMGGISVNDVLSLIHLAFPLRHCTKKFKKGERACLNYHIGICNAPCQNNIDRTIYLENVYKAIDFLNGNDRLVEELLKQKMLAYANLEQFEKAINCKQKLELLNKISQKRITETGKSVNLDVITYATNNIYSAINLLIVRGGRVLGSKSYPIDSLNFNEEENVKEFIASYYGKTEVELPPEIIVNINLEEVEGLQNYLLTVHNKKSLIKRAEKGIKKSLLELSQKNATEYLDKEIDKITHKLDMTKSACQKLQQVLSLKNYPKRIECYDISHISGTDKVGSMVVFTEGEKDQKNYRRFKIKTVEGNNDFASLKEVLLRRLNKLNSLEIERFSKPDLIIIDGGKGQLSSVKEIFDGLGITDIDLISLAKREEEVFTIFSNKPIILEKTDYVLKLLQRIRDEAHRFAITYHRSLRGKRQVESLLEEIEGLGKVKIQALLDRFKDINGIMTATKEELMQVKNIGTAQANAIIEYFKR